MVLHVLNKKQTHYQQNSSATNPNQQWISDWATHWSGSPLLVNFNETHGTNLGSDSTSNAKNQKKTENSKRRSTSAKPMKRNRRKPRCSEIEMNETVGHGQKAQQLMPRPDACVTLSTSWQWTMRWCSPVCTCQILCHMIRSLLHDTFFWNARRLRVANNIGRKNFRLLYYKPCPVQVKIKKLKLVSMPSLAWGG